MTTPFDTIKTVELLQAQSGDVVVCTIDDDFYMSDAEKDHSMSIIKNKFPAGVEVLFLQGITLKLLRPTLISQEDLDKLKKYELGEPDGKTD